MAKPPFPWIGSKEKIAPYILQLFPPKLTQYVEPFGGSGAVLLALPPDPNRLDIYNDLDAELVNLFSCIKECSNVLLRELKFLPIHGRKLFEYYRDFVAHKEVYFQNVQAEIECLGDRSCFTEEQAGELLPIFQERLALYDVKRAAAYYLAIRGSFSGTINSFGVKGLDVERFLKLFPPVSARLKDVPLENKNALQLIRERDKKGSLTVTFPANGAKYYDLPLVREVFGRHAKEKLARFVLEKPLKKPVQVELSVHYQYGDIDSYQLVAYSRELDQTIYSFWLDTEALVLPNPVPSFSEVTLERRIIREEDIKEVYEAFLRVHEKIVNPVRPARLKYGSVYAIPKNSARYYSKYLFELNKGGMPYFSIQNFFKRESLNETLPYISKLFGTGVFSAIGGILCGDLPANHDLGEDEQTGQDENKVLINNMADIASNFGVFFALKDKDEKSEKIYNTIENILSFYKQKKYPKIQHWAPITKYVRSAKDPHEIWNYFRASLEQLQPRKPRSTIYDLRAISGVCFQTETWIFDLFHGPNGRDEVEGIIENIIATLYDRDCLSERNPQDKYNPRKIRDVLELLLCICRLKAEDPSILDCNEQRTKLLVKQLKKIDSDIRKMGEDGRLKYSFNSRLGITAPEAYSRVNPVIYALIETLSGGEQVSLIGFSDEEDDD